MSSNPFLGLLFHWIGGLAAGSFYVFYGRVRYWSWEVYWLTGGFFSWVALPGMMAIIMTEDFFGVLARTPGTSLFLAWLFGALWGLGSLMAGLAIRYLGMSLGQGVTLGFCAAFGTLLPPLFRGQLSSIALSSAGQVVLAGVGVSLVGIVVSALAGLSKEREMPAEKKKAAVKEFSFVKGMIVSIVAGIMSGFMAFALDVGRPISDLSTAAGTAPMWAGLPKMVVILFGGFSSNLIACVILIACNKSGRQWLNRRSVDDTRVPLAPNYIFCALAGLTWYLQYFFYTMGESQMGAFAFSSWTLHLSSIIIFSSMWGWFLHEWKGTSRRSHLLFATGLVVLVLSTVIVGYGNYLGVHASK